MNAGSTMTRDRASREDVPVAPSARNRTRSFREFWERTVPWRWLSPSIALIALIVVFPALYMLLMSFLEIDRIGQIVGFAGFNNYARLFAEPALGLVVGNTLLWLIVVVGLTMLGSLALAQFLTKRFFGRKLVRLALIVPWASSLVMTATVWRFIYEGGTGMLNRVLMDIGILNAPVEWYKDPSVAFYAIMAVAIITSMPFTSYVILSGLQAISKDVFEAARIDGATAWGMWRFVTLPLLRPSLIVALVLNMLHVFNGFAIIWVISGKVAGNHTDTTVTWMYKIAFTAQLDSGEASALAVLNVLFLVVLIAAYLRVLQPTKDSADAVSITPAFGYRRMLEGWADRRIQAARKIRGVFAPVSVRVASVWRYCRPVGLPLIGLIIAAFFLAPYVVMFLGSLKTSAELFSYPATYFPESWAWSNYIDLWNRIPFADYLRVSLTVAVISTAGVLLISAPAAFVLSRTRFKGKAGYMGLILVTQMFPAVALLIGLYREALFFDAVNSYWFIIAVNTAFNLAFAIWILHAQFGAIPVEIDEAAMLDGLGRFRIMVRMILPLALPGVVTVTIFSFIQVWNEFIIALTLFNDPANGLVPLTVGIQQFIGLYETNYQYLFAASLIAIVPTVILFAAIEKHLAGGLTLGSTK